MQTTSRRYFVLFGAALAAPGCVSSRLEPPSEHPASAKAKPAPLELASLLATKPASARPQPAQAPAPADGYTCPMHPQISQKSPGKCPICGMNLVKK